MKKVKIGDIAAEVKETFHSNSRKNSLNLLQRMMDLTLTTNS
jgi:hypothetical protein